VADFDNNLDFLAHSLAKEDPALLQRVVFSVFKDKTRVDRKGNVVPVGTPHAFEDFQEFLDAGVELNPEWAKANSLQDKDQKKAALTGIPKYIPLINPDTNQPLGPAKDLGTNWILVVDSLWSMGRTAFLEHAKQQPTADKRQTFGGAGQMILAMVDNFKDPEFSPHVIVISHMTSVELSTGNTKLFPSSIGKANPMDIPKLFPRLLMAERKGQGKRAEYVISTISSDDVDVGTALPTGAVPDHMPQEEALAMYFKACGAIPQNQGK